MGEMFVIAHPGDVGDDQEVDEEQRPVHASVAANEFVDFHRDVESARNDGEPLGPDALAPESVGFDEAKSRVGEGTDADEDDIPIHDLAGGVEEHSSEAAIRIDVEEIEDIHGRVLKVDVVAEQGDECERHGQHQYTFEGFDRGDGT